jgi:hypothetical protein
MRETDTHKEYSLANGNAWVLPQVTPLYYCGINGLRVRWRHRHVGVCAGI